MHLQNCAVKVFLISAILTLAGCAYRLPTIAPPSQQLVRIVAIAPEQYTVQVNTGAVKEYDVPHDGRIQVGIPSYRPTCGVYLFNAIKVRGDGDPLKGWIVSVTRKGKTVRMQSFAGHAEVSDRWGRIPHSENRTIGTRPFESFRYLGIIAIREDRSSTLS